MIYKLHMLMTNFDGDQLIYPPRSLYRVSHKHVDYHLSLVSPYFHTVNNSTGCLIAHFPLMGVSTCYKMFLRHPVYIHIYINFT